MATSTKSYIKYELSGVARDQFPFEFPYLDVSDITVELPLDYAGTYTINASTNTVELSRPISVGTILIRRRTAQAVKHVFANLMRFNFKAVDENFKQCLYWFQEALDSFDFFSVSALGTRIDEVEAGAAHAVAGEAAARADATLAEELARASAIFSEASARAAAVTAEANARAAAIQQEASDRAASVAAEASARGTAITNEQTARQLDISQLAQQITTITAAGADAFDAEVQWNFDTDGDAQGWSGAHATVSVAGGWLRCTATGADHWLSCSGLSLNGALYPLIRARVRRVAGSGWDGGCFYYKTGVSGDAGHRWCPQPDALKSVGGVAILEWDMSKADAWLAAWSSSVLSGLRIDLGNTIEDVFEIDWIAVGRNAPGASMAGLQAEQTARQSGDSANAASITTLAARLNGGGDISTAIATAQNTANAAVSTGSANSSAITALQSSVGATNASLTTESSTRASADSANAARSDALAARLNGGGDIATAIATAQNIANTAVSAGKSNASSITAVSARLDTGDIHNNIASVTTTANAAASQAGATNTALSATWQVQVDAAGKVAGLKAYSTGATSGFVISADKVLIGDLTNLVAGDSSTGASSAGWDGVLAANWGETTNSNYWLHWTSVKSRYALLFTKRDTAYGNSIPVKAGDKFYLSMDTLADGPGTSVYDFNLCLYGSDVSGQIVWWDMAAKRPAGTSGHLAVSGVSTIPGNVASVKIYCQIANNDGGPASGVGRGHWATNIIVRRMNGAELIVDGAITANKISAWKMLVGQFISSSNYVPGSSGWIINADGSAELQNIKARGDIEATTLRAGTVMVGGGHIYTEAASITRAAHVGGTEASTTDAQAVFLTVNVSSANMTTSTYIATVQGYWITAGLNTISPIFDIVRADGSQVGRMTMVNGGGDYWIGTYSGSATAEGRLQLALQPQYNHSLVSFHISMAGLTVINTR